MSGQTKVSLCGNFIAANTVFTNSASGNIALENVHSGLYWHIFVIASPTQNTIRLYGEANVLLEGNSVHVAHFVHNGGAVLIGAQWRVFQNNAPLSVSFEDSVRVDFLNNTVVTNRTSVNGSFSSAAMSLHGAYWYQMMTENSTLALTATASFVFAGNMAMLNGSIGIGTSPSLTGAYWHIYCLNGDARITMHIMAAVVMRNNVAVLHLLGRQTTTVTSVSVTVRGAYTKVETTFFTLSFTFLLLDRSSLALSENSAIANVFAGPCTLTMRGAELGLSGDEWTVAGNASIKMSGNVAQLSDRSAGGAISLTSSGAYIQSSPLSLFLCGGAALLVTSNENTVLCDGPSCGELTLQKVAGAEVSFERSNVTVGAPEGQHMLGDVCMFMKGIPRINVSANALRIEATEYGTFRSTSGAGRGLLLAFAAGSTLRMGGNSILSINDNYAAVVAGSAGAALASPFQKLRAALLSFDASSVVLVGASTVRMEGNEAHSDGDGAASQECPAGAVEWVLIGSEADMTGVLVVSAGNVARCRRARVQAPAASITFDATHTGREYAYCFLWASALANSPSLRIRANASSIPHMVEAPRYRIMTTNPSP